MNITTNYQFINISSLPDFRKALFIIGNQLSIAQNKPIDERENFFMGSQIDYIEFIQHETYYLQRLKSIFTKDVFSKIGFPSQIKYEFGHFTLFWRKEIKLEHDDSLSTSNLQVTNISIDVQGDQIFLSGIISQTTAGCVEEYEDYLKWNDIINEQKQDYQIFVDLKQFINEYMIPKLKD